MRSRSGDKLLRKTVQVLKRSEAWKFYTRMCGSWFVMAIVYARCQKLDNGIVRTLYVMFRALCQISTIIIVRSRLAAKQSSGKQNASSSAGYELFVQFVRRVKDPVSPSLFSSPLHFSPTFPFHGKWSFSI